MEWGWREVSSILCRGALPGTALAAPGVWLLTSHRGDNCAGQLVPEAALEGFSGLGMGRSQLSASAERQRLVPVELQGLWAGVGLVLVLFV